MIWYVVFIAAINMVLGYALALLLGRGPQALQPMEIIPSTVSSEAMPAESLKTQSDIDFDAFERAAAEETAAEAVISEDETMAALQKEKARKMAEAAAQAEPRDKGSVETNVEDIMSGLQQFRDQIAQLDKKVRDNREANNNEAVVDCVKEFKDVNNAYLEKTSEAAERLREESVGGGKMSQVSQSVQQAIAKQTKEVESSNRALDKIDLEKNLDNGAAQLLEETSGMVETNCKFRDEVNSARVEIAREEGWLDRMDAGMLIDEVTGLPTRAAFENMLEDSWNKDPHRTRTLSIAMVDIDHCNRLNSEHGQQLGNEALKAVSLVISASVREQEFVCCYGGQKFVVLFEDQNARTATSRVEKVRQAIEETEFKYQETEIDITISCAVTEVEHEDTAKTLFKRLEHTLQEAKRYGRNRTFLHEGKYPAPIVPPNLKVDHREYDLKTE